MVLENKYYIGRTGTGKSTLMLKNAIDAIENNHGVFYLDPNGSDIDTLLKYIPPRRRNETILFDPTEFIVSFNPLDNVKDKNLTAENILYALKDIWKFNDLSTPTFDEYVLYSLLTLLYKNDPTLLAVKFLLTKPDYRASLYKNLPKYITDFWADFDALTPKERRDEIRSTKNKFNAILADRRLQRTLGQSKTALDMADVLEGRILLVRLKKGYLGNDKTRLLGMLLLAELYTATLQRESETPFEVFVKDIHTFQGQSLTDLTEISKDNNVFLHLSNQSTTRLKPEMLQAVLANLENRYLFSNSRKEAQILDDCDKETHSITQLWELKPGQYRLGEHTHNVPPLPQPVYSNSDIRTSKRSAEKYARSAKDVDGELDRFFSSV